MKNDKEVWLRGPLTGVPAILQPVAHALLQAQEEVRALTADMPQQLLWLQPAGVASPGFHLQHLAGVLDRLFTYAQNEQLNEQQLAALANEGKPVQISLPDLIAIFDKSVEDALAALKTVDIRSLTDRREVGRGRLPSTVIGLYTHAAEHTMRHLGQLMVTVKVLEAGL